MKTLLSPHRHVRPLRFFLQVNPREAKWFVFMSVFYAIASSMILLVGYVLSQLVNAITLGKESLGSFIIWIIASLVLGELFWRIGHVIEIHIFARVRRNTKKALFDHTSQLSFGYFSDRFAGEISHRVSSTADAFERLMMIMGNVFTEVAIWVPLAAFALGSIHIYYGLFIVVWGVLFVFFSVLMAKETNRRVSVLTEAEAKTSGAMVDTYGNIGAVKVYGNQKKDSQAHEKIESETVAFKYLGRWEVLTYSFQGMASISLWLGILWISAFLYRQDLLALGTIVFLSSAIMRLSSVIFEMFRDMGAFIRARGEISQNLEDLIVAPAILDGHQNLSRPHEKVSIEYRDVSFSYQPRRPILKNFSLSIQPGEKVGIVGLSGAGKTTFANLLLRFFEVEKGAVLLNGVDIRELTQDFLRSHLSYISQESSLFHASVAENIAYGSAVASPVQIEKAAKLAYADDFIKNLSHGYQSIVGERGIKLSGGQRQRIAIARAILADRPVFLLDEATSALDSDSEKKIQKALINLMKGKTVIAIAHRLSTLSHMDRIIYLEKGKIAESGSHAELLQFNGKYAKLWHMQAGGFLPE